MKEIIIQGTPHPIHFGLRAIDEFVRQRGAEFGQTVASTNALGSLDSIVALTATGLNEGARRAGSDRRYTEDEVWDIFDEEPSLILAVSELFVESIVPLTDMLSMVSTRELVTEDTPENREQAYYDMAWLTENMIMRNRTHGGYKVLLDELWEFCEEFNADMVILWEHMSCKALDGMHGLFEERAREHGIHLVWVTHDLFDPRVISRQGVRQQVNDYMRTVMQEEPVDPSLEILKDEKSW